MLLVLEFLPLLASALIWAVAWAAVRAAMRAPFRRVVVEAAFVGYLGALFYVVFMLPVGAEHGVTSVWAAVNLIPARTVLGIIREHPGMVTWQLFGNVLLFVPLGLLLPLVDRRFRRLSATALTGLSVSAGIELVQFGMLLTATARRSVDIDDVILNVVGVCIGYVLWWGMHSLARSAASGRDVVEDAA